MSIELRIKAQSLTAEARIIRRYEQRLKRMKNHRVRQSHGDAVRAGPTVMRDVPGTNPAGYERWGNAKLLGLQNHRKKIVGHEARKTCLALAFLNGTPLNRAEQKTHDNNQLREGDLNAILRMVELYGGHRLEKFSADPKTRAQAMAQRFAAWAQGE